MTKHKQYKAKMLIFEGPDKVGKSTLIKKINEITNYEFFCIDRFTGSAWVYDKLTGRRNITDELIKIEKEFSQLKNLKIINILLRCDSKVLRQRIIQEDGYSKLRIHELNETIKLYHKYLAKVSCLPIIVIDTTNKTITQTAAEILKKITQYE